MSDPALAIQGAIHSALAGAGVCGGRIYDSVPEEPEFPYVAIGTGDTVNADTSCFDSSEVNATVHVWSREVGWPEAKGIAGTIRALLNTELAISGFRVVVAEHVITRWLNDPDGLTKHAVLEFRYLTDHEL